MECDGRLALSYSGSAEVRAFPGPKTRLLQLRSGQVLEHTLSVNELTLLHQPPVDLDETRDQGTGDLVWAAARSWLRASNRAKISSFGKFVGKP